MSFAAEFPGVTESHRLTRVHRLVFTVFGFSPLKLGSSPEVIDGSLQQMLLLRLNVLHCVLAAVLRLPLVAAVGGSSWLRCTGLSLASLAAEPGL